MKSLTFWAIIIVLAIELLSCKHDRVNLVPIVQCPADTIANISFSKNIVPIFQVNCAISGCHTGNMPAGSLNLDSSVAYSQLTRPGSTYIDTAAPKNSLLYSRMTSATQPMPPTGTLDSCTLNMITKWMSQGARNN